MNKLFVPFLPPWVETGLQPAFYDRESGTVLQQTARMYDKVNQLIRNFNELSEETKTTVEEYILKFNDLKDFVDDYFDNLDVQEEINNKLDAMAEAGTLQEIITEYIQANTAWCFNTVADMKTATNFVNGSYARTLGFHTLNDGGGALYKVRTITNDDVVDEARIIELDDDTLIAELIPTEPLNVKQMGVAGDGITDDTLAIQHVIDTSPQTTIYFPDGTYLVSATITTPATDNQKVFLELDANAIIKASDDFTGSFVLSIGYDGTASGYGDSVTKTGINGGIIDANGQCGGLQVTKTHLAKVLNLSIIGVLTTGLQIDKSNNDSSDVYVENVDISGTNSHDEDTIGVKLNGFDNNLNMIRTRGLHIGIQANGGGNYLTECHPLYSDSDQTWYESSIGFELKSNDTKLTNCYSDNFSTCIQVDGDYRWFAKEFFAFWYTNENVNHTVIKNKHRNFSGKIDGLQLHFPSNGTNRGLVIEEDGWTNQYPEVTSTNADYRSGCITNLQILDWSRMTNKYSDPILLAKLNKQNVQYFGGTGDGIEANKWYPIALFTKDSTEQRMNVSIGTAIMLDLGFKVDSSGIKIHDLNILENRDANVFKLGVGKITDVSDVYILYYMVTTKNTTGTNWVVTATSQPPYVSRQIILPRNSVYSGTGVLDGISSLPNQAYVSIEFNSRNDGNGFFYSSTWSNTHTINLCPLNSSVQHGVLIFINYGSNYGVYGVYRGTIMPINTTNINTPPTMSITNNVLTITSSESASISYVRL